MIVVALILPAQILTILLSPLLSFNLSYPEFFFVVPHPQITISPLYKTVPESSLILSQSPLWNLWTWSQSSVSLFGILNTLPFFCFLPANYISPGLHLLLCKSLSCLVFLIIAVYYLIAPFSYGYSQFLLSSSLLFLSIEFFTLLFSTTFW